jgi:hypothetical protein
MADPGYSAQVVEAHMAAGWITRINNFSDYDFTVSTDDGTWRPIIGGRQYAKGEPIAVPKRRATPIVIPAAPPWIPFDITVPPGPTSLDVSYMMIGWIDWARTTITGPGDSIAATIGPVSPGSNDYLRFFDDTEIELGNVELGPRGPGSTASVDFHLNIYNPTPLPGDPPQAAGVKFVYWSSHNVGADILDNINKRIGKFADVMVEELAKKVSEKVFKLVF